MNALLLWLSGVDPNLLAKCSRLPDSERKRFAGYGGMVLIPATAGMFAMGYATFTFIPDAKVAITGGVVWSAVVLWIDRFLAMTLHKSALMPAYKFAGGVLLRLLLAGTLGYGLAHPMMLLVFRGPIEQWIADQAREKEQAVFEQANGIKSRAYQNLIEARVEATRDLAAEVDRKTELWECKSTLVSLEQAKGVAPGTAARDRDGNVCGVASGEESCKARCRVYLQERDEIAGEITSIRQQMQTRINAIDNGDMARAALRATEYADRLQQDVSAETPPVDYATRSRALAAVEARDPSIRAVHSFLVFLLVVLDTMLVSLKVLTPRGEYEEVRDSALAEARAIGQAERAATAAWANSHYQNLLQARLTHEAHKTEIAALLQAVNDIFQEQVAQFRQFESKMRSLYENVRKVKNDEDRQIFVDRMADIRRTYSEVWSKALDRFRAYIRSL